MAKVTLEHGAIIDGFVLDKCVHHGGMATLWAATRPGLDAPVLIKVPKISEGDDPAAIVGFEMEQMIAPRLSGPHVPACYGVGDFTRQPYVAMERIPGETLYKRIDELPMPYGEAAAIVEKVALALDDLHRQHVIHHDIKPSSVMFRPSGEAVLIDFGLSHHAQLPDLLQAEFRLPFGTAPYMAPECLLGVRDDPRSDIFSLGVLLYFFTTGVRPFGEGETLRAMRRRLWRDPVPPRKLQPDYPPWLQEIVLRCLEINPSARYPTAAQLAFDLSHPDLVKLTARSRKLERDSFLSVWHRRFNPPLVRLSEKSNIAGHLTAAPIAMVTLDVTQTSPELDEAIRVAVKRILAAIPGARLACVNVLKLNRVAIDKTLDEQGNNKHIDRLVALAHWAAPLKLDQERLSTHVLEAFDPADAILEFAKSNCVDHILIGARQHSFRRSLLGSVSSKVAAEATCTVTVIRPSRVAGVRDEDVVWQEPVI
ncbi:MAG: serine/threonine protein kinase [Bradyrhizobiaceae bacterium]|nr:MAG: serine/threonine protein kinase [Bradyrhizobiaceae bacterium]